MKRFVVLLLAVLVLSLPSGCMPAVVVTSPLDESFQKDWSESMDELRKDAQEDLEDMENSGEEDGEDGPWSAWSKEWKAWLEDGEDRFSDVGKIHRWKVLDREEEEVCVISEEEMVKTLDDILLDDGDDWDRLAKDPGEPACTYVYSQEETIKAGQAADKERAYEDLLQFTVSATENVVTVQILGGLEELSLLPGVEMEDVLTFHVSVPAETVQTLRNYSQFSE